MSVVLVFKLFAAPLLIGVASLAGKRWGPQAAGLMGGLPLVGAPIVLVLWLTQGDAIAIQTSTAAPVGVWATMVYLLTLGFASARLPWYLLIPLGWACYLAANIALEASGFAHSPVLGVAIIPVLWIAATRVLPKPVARPEPTHLPHIELLARMAAAAVLVVGLTTIAARIGASMTGLLSGAPVAATVIPAFTLATAGRDSLLLALRGFLTGLTGFATFFLILAEGIPKLGALVLLPATIASIVVGLGAARLARSRVT